MKNTPGNEPAGKSLVPSSNRARPRLAELFFVRGLPSPHPDEVPSLWFVWDGVVKNKEIGKRLVLFQVNDQMVLPNPWGWGLRVVLLCLLDFLTRQRAWDWAS